MPVYVDDMYRLPLGRFGRMKMSHMIADSQAELLAMVRAIGVSDQWIQDMNTHKEHFDISMAKRALAIQHGAIEITLRQVRFIVEAKRRGLVPVVPIATALEIMKDAEQTGATKIC